MFVVGDPHGGVIHMWGWGLSLADTATRPVSGQDAGTALASPRWKAKLYNPEGLCRRRKPTRLAKPGAGGSISMTTTVPSCAAKLEL